MNEETEHVYVVVADYGLNGADVLAVYRVRPDNATVRALEAVTFTDGKPPTGYSGIEVVECEVRP